MATSWHGETALGGSALSIVVGQNYDGRLEIFYTGTSEGLYHNWQITAGVNEWAGETRFPGDSAKQIAVARNTNGELEIFYVGTNNNLYHNRQTSPGSSSWVGETELPLYEGISANQVAVAQNSDGRLVVFYVGSNNAIYYTRQLVASSTEWLGQTALPGDASFWVQQVIVGQNHDGRLAVFWTRTDFGTLFILWQTAAGVLEWSGESIFGSLDSAQQVAVGCNSDGTLEIFYVGTNNDLYHNRQASAGAGGWAGETRFPNASALQVAVGQNLNGALEIFYVVTNTSLYHNWQASPGSTDWVGETAFPGDSAKQIAVGRNADGRLEIFYVGTNFRIYHNWQLSPMESKLPTHYPIPGRDKG